jgi:AraC-like DNA-binding protein
MNVLSVEGTERKWAMVHTTITVGAVTRGRGRFRCRGRDAEIHPAALMLIDRGELHSTRAVSEPGDFDAFFLDAPFLHACLGEEHADVHFRGVSAVDEAAVASLVAFRRALGRPDLEPLEVSEKATTTFRELFERHATNLTQPPPVGAASVAEAVDLIRTAFEDDPEAPDLTIAWLAGQLGLNQLGLIRDFTSTIGLPPFQYLQRLRVERVRRLIEDGPDHDEGLCNLTDVAVAAGFYDLSHMGRIFRRVLALSPRSYARQLGCYRAWTTSRAR